MENDAPVGRVIQLLWAHGKQQPSAEEGKKYDTEDDVYTWLRLSTPGTVQSNLYTSMQSVDEFVFGQKRKLRSRFILRVFGKCNYERSVTQ